MRVACWTKHRRVIAGIEATENFLVSDARAGKSGTTWLFDAVHAGLENHLRDLFLGCLSLEQ